MQRLLNHAVWDHRQAQQVVSEFVIEHLACPDEVLVLEGPRRHLQLGILSSARSGSPPLITARPAWARLSIMSASRVTRMVTMRVA
jgi:hypothetical protein